MKLARRDLMLGSAGLGLALAAGSARAGTQPQDVATVSKPMSSFGLVPGSGKLDQSASLQMAIEQAVFSSTPLFIPAGTYTTGTLRLKSGLKIIGVPGQTVLRLLNGDSLLKAKGADGIQLSGLTLDGTHANLSADGALLSAVNVTRLDISDCRFLNSPQNGVSLRGCQGRFSQNEIGDIRAAGFFSNDAKGLEVSHNWVRNCGDNGIQIWRSEPGEDGSLVLANRVEKISAKSGGSGQNGNGINVFRAGSVLVSGNRISDCTYSAIRDNSGGNCQIIGNSCSRFGETAIFVEFAFDGAVVSQNVIDTAALGISVTNFNDGGHLAVVQGNLVRNISYRKDGEARGIGIAVEADCAVTGNVIDTVAAYGITLGWLQYLRDITATGNLVRNCGIGIGVSVNPKAGKALIADNMISGSKNGAIRAMNGDQAIGEDLAVAGAKPYANVAVASNVGT